jgi:hypothetical protein
MSLPESDRRVLYSIGVLCILIAVGIILSLPEVALITPLMIPPFIISLYGLWMIGLAGAKARSPERYERSPFSTFSWGILLAAIGGAWFLYGYNLLYSLLVVLIVFGILAIVAAMRRKK